MKSDKSDLFNNLLKAAMERTYLNITVGDVQAVPRRYDAFTEKNSYAR